MATCTTGVTLLLWFLKSLPHVFNNSLFIFVFSDVPCDVVSFTLTVHNRGKRGKDSEVAELTLDLSSLGNGEEREEWYPLSGLTPMGEWGSLRLRTR